jgi:ABC-type amino acid transport system permease subunit
LDGSVARILRRERGRAILVWRTPAEIWLLPLFGFVSTLLYCFSEKPFTTAFMQVLGVSLLIAGASFLVGALLGFLFGIPRALRSDDALTSAQLAQGQRYAGNSNLEQISDWLTKILIGAGLVQLGSLTARIGELSDSVGNALGGSEQTANTVALALILFFFSSGFLVIYVYTRVDFGPLMARTEEQYTPTVAPEPPPLPPPPGDRKTDDVGASAP